MFRYTRFPLVRKVTGAASARFSAATPAVLTAATSVPRSLTARRLASQAAETEKQQQQDKQQAQTQDQQDEQDAPNTTYKKKPKKNWGEGGVAIPDEVESNEISYETYVPMQEFESEVRVRNQSRLGEGTYDLYRALYKDLCDEMRREDIARAPPPVEGWTAHHTPHTRFVHFKRTPRPGEDFTVDVHADVALVDPVQVNEVLQFLNWYPLDVYVRRAGYVYHIQCCYVEASPQVRNQRIYYDPDGELACDGRDVAKTWERNMRRYDGPFHGHMEMDMQTEAFDQMLDVGLDCYFMRYASDWIAYLEHVEYTRWTLGVLDAIAPQVRHPRPGPEAENPFREEDFVSREERMILDTQAEEWMPERTK